MTRIIHADVVTELAKPSFRTAHLIKIDFSTPVYLSDYAHDITYNSINYEAGGQLLDVASITETADIRVGSIGINLTSVHQASIATLLSEETTDRQAVIYRAAIDSSGVIIGDPIMVYDGRITSFTIEETEGTGQVTITLASHWADFELKAGRKTNDNSQQMFFLNDLGMAFSGLMTQDIKWGRL